MIDSVITKIERITHESVALTIAPLDKREIRFNPGQFLTIETAVGEDVVRRSYSLCVPPSAGCWQVGIKEVPEGIFSTWANKQAKVGDRIKVLEPDGRFTLPEGATNALMIAAGSGITPMLSNIESALETKSDTSITLLYSNKNTGSVMFRKRLGDLKDRYLGRLRVVHVFSREDGGSDLLSGRLDATKLSQLYGKLFADTAPDFAMICGPYEMTKSAERVLKDCGLDAANVLTELFGAPAPSNARPRVAKPVSEELTASITVDEVTTVVRVGGPDQSLLDAGLASGLELPYACKGGVCSTCRAKVIEGDVHMANNFALEEYEIEQGYVLSCQCFSDSAHVVLDFDQ